ncbi:hypothetical protein [Lysobacter yananisis]
MPRWLAKKLRFGQHPIDFLIPGIAKPTARTTSSVGKRTLVKQGCPSPREAKCTIQEATFDYWRRSMPKVLRVLDGRNVT